MPALASANHQPTGDSVVEPVSVSGNFNCRELGLAHNTTYLEIRVQSPRNGTFPSAGASPSVTILNSDGTPFDWTATTGLAGTKVARVVFTLDGKRIKTLRQPNFRNTFAIRIYPRKLKVGVHRLVARAFFETGSNTRPKVMRLSFQRCARKRAAPRFTG